MRELAARAGDDELNDAHVTAADALQVFALPQAPEGCVFEEHVFGRGGDHRLDLFLYRPADTSEPHPAIVFVHGGGLRSGFPEMHGWQAAALAAAGYVSASIDYRVFPETTWPGALEDVKCAVRWLRAHATALGVDSARIAVVGGSAGGYLAALLALTPGLYEGDGGQPEEASAVSAAVLFYPLTDMSWPSLAPDVQQLVADFLGGDDQQVYREGSPATYVKEGAPPFLILTGDRDREVPVEMVRAFHEQLLEAGVESTLHVFSGAAHAFDYALPAWHETFALASSFLNERLAPSTVAHAQSE